MITAEDLFLQANISPIDLGPQIVPPTVTDEEDQKTLTIAHIEDNILPKAETEVSVPLIRSTDGYSLPLPEDRITRRYPSMDGDDEKIAAVQADLQSLYDDAVRSFARHEIYIQVATNQRSYDEDAAREREYATQKLMKLLDAVSEIMNVGVDLPGSDVGKGGTGRTPPSSAATTQFTF